MPLFGGDGIGRFAVLHSGIGGLRFGRLLHCSGIPGLYGCGLLGFRLGVRRIAEDE